VQLQQKQQQENRLLTLQDELQQMTSVQDAATTPAEKQYYRDKRSYLTHEVWLSGLVHYIKSMEML